MAVISRKKITDLYLPAHHIFHVPNLEESRTLRVVHLGQRLRDFGNGSLCLFAIFALAPAAAGCENLFANGGVNLGDLSAIKQGSWRGRSTCVEVLAVKHTLTHRCVRWGAKVVGPDSVDL